MKIFKLLICFGIIFSPMACSKSTMKFKPIKNRILKDVPGASGVAFQKEKIYIIGDNAPFLFELDQQGNLLSKFQIHSLNDYHDNRFR